MVERQKVQTFRTDTYSEDVPQLHLEWLMASQVIDEAGYFEQERVLRENQDDLAEIDSKHLEATNKIAFLETKLSSLPLNSPEISQINFQLAELEVSLVTIEEEKKEAMAILQKKIDDVTKPTIIERNYSLLGLSSDYELAIVDEPPKYYPNENVFTIYKKSNFISSDYTGRKQASLDESSPEFQANEFKGWKYTQNTYEITHIYAGLLTTKYIWLPAIQLKSNLSIDPLTNPKAFELFLLLKDVANDDEKLIEALKGEPDAYKLVDIVGMKLITQNYDDDNRDGNLELISSSSYVLEENEVSLYISNQDQLLVTLDNSSSNVDFTFINNNKEPQERLKFNERNPLYHRRIKLSTIKSLNFSKSPDSLEVADYASLSNASLRYKFFFDSALNTKGTLNVYGKYWSIDKLDLTEVYDYGYTYYPYSSDTPPGVAVRYDFTPREYNIKVTNS